MTTFRAVESKLHTVSTPIPQTLQIPATDWTRTRDQPDKEQPMNTRSRVVATITGGAAVVAVLVAAPALAATGNGQGAGMGAGPTNLASGTLTATQKAELAAMAEEEKLAHDLYVVFGDKHGIPFSRITNAETRHLVAFGG